MAAQNKNNPNVDQVKNILAHGKINEVIDYYKKQLGDRDNFVDAYLHQILHLGLSIKNDDRLFNTFLENYSIFFQPLSSQLVSQSSYTNIYHCSVPKAATTWIKRIMTDSRLYLHSGLAPFQAEFLENTKTIPTNTIVTGTFSIHFDDFLKLNKPQSYKAFFVMRDPRDIVISAYFSNRYSHLLMDHIGETRKILNDLSLEEGIIYTIDILRNVFSILNSWIDAPSKDANILLFRYEELTGKQNIESFKRLCTHCDIKISDSLISQILSDYSFKKLSQGRQQGDENHNSHYRKGLPGDWKNHFTHKVRQHFEEVTGNLIDRLGYVWDDSSSPLDRERNPVDVVSKTSVALPEKSLIPIEQILKLSHEHFVKNQLPDALDNYQKSIAILEAKLAESYFYMGSIHLKSNHIDLAIEFYKKSIEFNPNLADSYFYLGNLYRIKNEIDLAKFTYQKCLEINSELADAHFYLGSIYFSENQLGKAENHYNMCLKINPNLADAYFYLGEICIKKTQVERGIFYHKKYKKLRNS